MHCTPLKLVLALVAVIVCLPAPAAAQELRKDSVWDGVVVGAAMGGDHTLLDSVRDAEAVKRMVDEYKRREGSTTGTPKV